MAIDWDSAPEGFPVWVESFLSSFKSDWHKENEGSYTDRAGVSWSKPGETLYIAHHRPASWNGKGAPPVGTVCEMATIGVFWETVEIMFLSKTYAITKGVEGEQHWHIRDVTFRLIRTPEQVAADEREIVINDMLSCCTTKGTVTKIIQALYDAGYRKQKEPM